MFCPYCGTNNEDSGRFCYKCGRRLREDAEKPAVEGPVWRDFSEEQEKEPEPEPEPVPAAPPPPPPPQVVIGPPKRKLPIASILLGILAAAAIAGIAAGGYFAVTRVDWNALPLIGDDGTSEGSGNGGTILSTFDSTCVDAANAPCSVRWDVTSVSRTAQDITVGYELRPTGQGDCTVPFPSDQQATARANQAGKPGVYLEGGRARLYSLTASTGFLLAGGSVPCGEAQQGTWTFALPEGETAVKLRYPGLDVLRIETAVEGATVRVLPPDDPISVIPLQGPNCRTVNDQQCRGAWEIGPFGLDHEGSPVVFFAVRYEGVGECHVNWQADLPFHAAEIAANRPGIRLEIVGDLDLLLTGTGGLAAETKTVVCGQVQYGYWVFAKGNVPQSVNLIYPDIPKLPLPIRP